MSVIIFNNKVSKVQIKANDDKIIEKVELEINKK